ncbi:sensor histidine kinase [Glycomyces terrestris]|uniref:histidine kinase n=1 Tax=Glycomyces terrestris TaxID=2493553 RepID=A0A426UWW2_9ACTN|nr:ATP-binding protein [Glycomyces terrestris]RRR99099.1 sensor histidine kinase [Glycomyces terrestris]
MSRKARQRTSRLPIRMQLMLPIAAALMGMLVLGLFQTVSVWDEYQNATDAEVLAGLSADLNDALEAHRLEAGPLVQSVIDGGGGMFDSAVARRETDFAFDRLEEHTPGVTARFPDLEDDLESLFAKAGELDSARAAFDRLASGEATFEDEDVADAYLVYRDVANKIVAIAAILPRLVDDAEVAAHLDSLAALMQASRIAAEIQFTVSTDLVGLAEAQAVVVGRAELSNAAYMSGNFDRQITEFQANASAGTSAVYKEAMDAEPIETAQEALGVYVRGNVPTISPEDFSDAQGAIVAALDKTQQSVLDAMQDDVEAIRDASSRTLLTTFALVIVLALTSIISAAMLARRISLRVDGVREATLTAAYDTLPKTVAAVSQAANADEVDRLLQTAKRQTVMSTDSRYADELDSLAEAFSAAHHQALRQTANQALLRIDVEAMMKTLARRGQSLIRRQQQVMESLVEQSPDHAVPEEWRSVYHLLARMRRNEENLLLLAGGDPQRRYNHPANLDTIIRDAVAEIEDAGRVVVENQVSARLETKPAGDLVRILAELLDNAAAYSPPTQSVRVTTRRSGSEIVISIADDGIGLAPEPMAAINRRLAEPTQLNSELTATMGLLVVGRLAAEHSVSVQLHSTMGKGTLALVRIPASAHAEDPVGLSPDQGSAARLALSARAANLPVTGTGAETAAPSAVEPIVPRPRKAGPSPEPRPVAGGTLNGGKAAQAPAGPAPETLDVTFRKVNRALEHSGRTNGAELPRRAPGSRLLPGSVPSARPGGGADLDPAEIRDRLAGFASGIAAAAAHEQRQ